MKQMTGKYWQFYFLSLAALLILSAYPLINGFRVAWLSVHNGSVNPEQYAKYIVPYTAMSLAILIFAAFQPLLFKLKRLSLPIGLIGVYGIFFAAEQFLEKIKIHTAGMALVNPSTLAPETADVTAPIDAWQASLCITSPQMLAQSKTYADSDTYLYVLGNDAYKIHFYLIAIVLMTMLALLIHGIGSMLRESDATRRKPLILQGMATAALLALCVFANTTAFFRQPGSLQTPLASTLTSLFFIVLGVAVGTFAGSFWLDRTGRASVLVAVSVALATVILMYAGEVAMMKGSLYRFGTDWFFTGIPGLVLAPADLLVICLSGSTAWLIIRTARRRQDWPGKWTAAGVLAVSVLIAVIAVAYPAGTMQPKHSAMLEVAGCYEYNDCLFMNPLSSFRPPVSGQMPIIYGFGENSLIIANHKTGDIDSFAAQYEKTPVAEDVFLVMTDFPESLDLDLSKYQDRWLMGVFLRDGQRQYGLYQMNDEIWLVDGRGGNLWSIYRLQKTEGTSLGNLEQAIEFQNDNPDKSQMTLTDVYALARKGSSLLLSDFAPFTGKRVGTDFSIMRFDVAASGCSILVYSDLPDDGLRAIRLVKQGYDPFDDALTVELRDGAGMVAAYLDPLNTLRELKIEDPLKGNNVPERELVYTDEHNGYRYYLNTMRADRIFVTFENGDRLPLKQALTERRLIIEDAVANGLGNVIMEPIENPLGGYFPILHHHFLFGVNGEDLYPSASFMYLTTGDYPGGQTGLREYFDKNELADMLLWQGWDQMAERLRNFADQRLLVTIAGKAYLSSDGLRELGVSSEIGWAVSAFTPVRFHFDPDN